MVRFTLKALSMVKPTTCIKLSQAVEEASKDIFTLLHHRNQLLLYKDENYDQ